MLGIWNFERIVTWGSTVQTGSQHVGEVLSGRRVSQSLLPSPRKRNRVGAGEPKKKKRNVSQRGEISDSKCFLPTSSNPTALAMRIRLQSEGGRVWETGRRLQNPLAADPAVAFSVLNRFCLGILCERKNTRARDRSRGTKEKKRNVSQGGRIPYHSGHPSGTNQLETFPP